MPKPYVVEGPDSVVNMITKHPTSRTLLIHPLGELDTLRSEHYRRQLRTLIDEGYRFLIFDLQDTPYINSSGLGLMVELYNKTSRAEGSVKLINCSSQVLWILGQTQLDKILLQPPEANPQTAADLHYDTIYPFMSDEILLLAQIHEITEQILDQEEAPAISEIILRGLTRALFAQRGVFFLLDEKKSRLRVSSWIDRDASTPPPELKDVEFEIGKPVTRIFEENQVAWHELCDRDKSEDNLFFRLGYQTFLAAPIHGRSMRFGLVVIEASPDTVKILQASKPLVRTCTNLCGLAMEKSSLIHQLRKRNESMSAALGQVHDYQHTLLDAGRLAALGVVITGLGHLINNKMVPLLGYTQMLSQKKDLSEWVSEKISRIHASGNEVTRIVEKLVKISNVREKNPVPLNHAELLRTGLDLLAGPIQQGEITVLLNPAADPPEVQGSPHLVLQALLAILHRACTSFPPDALERWIRIDCQATQEGLTIAIEDNGAPFNEDDEEGWLDPLMPLEALENGRIFNYTIPRAILRKQHGTLTLEPRAECGKRVVVFLKKHE